MIIMARNKKKRLKSMAEAAVGPEPTWDNVEITNWKFQKIKAYNWYNYAHNHKGAKKFILAYLKQEKNLDMIKVVRNTPDSEISLTLGWLCRMHTLKAPLQDKEYNFINEKLEKLKENYVNQDDVQETDSGIKVKRKSVLEYLHEKTNEQISLLEGVLDDYMMDGYKKYPDLYKFMQKIEVKGKHAAIIADRFRKIEMELVQVVNSNKPPEGYESYTKPELKKILKFYQDIIQNAERIILNASNARKPRKRKKRVLNKSKMVKKLNYLKEFPDMKLVSLNPEKIVGAKTLFLYNTKTGELALYMSQNTDGMTVKGSTLQNFHKEKSEIKRVGKKKDILDEIINLTNVKSIKRFRQIKRKINTCTGRVNKHTIILKVY